jgi:hypothetical protein
MKRHIQFLPAMQPVLIVTYFALQLYRKTGESCSHRFPKNKLSPGDAEQWACNRDSEVILNLNGHIKSQTYYVPVVERILRRRQ